MPCRLVLASLLVAGAQAFAPAPIRLGRFANNRLVLAPRDSQKLAPESIGIGAVPVKIVIREQPVGTSPVEVPHFVARLDKTIAWDGTRFCIEASGDKSGDVVLLNRCTGVASQLWNFVPLGLAHRSQIQLKNTNKCIDVDHKAISLNEAAVELRACDDELTESWAFEEPHLAMQHLTLSSSTRPLLISLLAMAVLGVLSLGTWVWKWQSQASAVSVGQSSMPSNVDQGGVSLMVFPNVEDHVNHKGFSADLPPHRAQPWVLPRVPHPVALIGSNNMGTTRPLGLGETKSRAPQLQASISSNAGPSEANGVATQQDIDILKQRLREAAAAFKTAQAAVWAEDDAAGREATTKTTKNAVVGGERYGAESNVSIDISSSNAQLSRLRDETVALIHQLQKLNPTAAPFDGWGSASGTKLDGRWKLLFTTAADATFRPTEKGGTSETSQEIDGKKGYFVNCVDFKKKDSKVKGFRVVIKGKKLSNTEVQLYFRRVKLLRRSKWLKKIIIPLPPSWFFRWTARRAARKKGQTLSDRGAGFTMLYLDDDLRAHVTFDGLYFVQERC